MLAHPGSSRPRQPPAFAARSAGRWLPDRSQSQPQVPAASPTEFALDPARWQAPAVAAEPSPQGLASLVVGHGPMCPMPCPRLPRYPPKKFDQESFSLGSSQASDSSQPNFRARALPIQLRLALLMVGRNRPNQKAKTAVQGLPFLSHLLPWCRPYGIHPSFIAASLAYVQQSWWLGLPQRLHSKQPKRS